MAFTIPNLGDASHEDQAFPTSTDIDILAAGISGDGVLSGCAVTAQGSPDMSVHVAAGEVRFGSTVVTVTAADPDVNVAAANPRRDLVVVDDGGAISVVAGTPQAVDVSDPSVVPVLPAVPASSLALAAVDVPANASSITSGEIVDKRIMLWEPTDQGVVAAGRPKSATTYHTLPGWTGASLGAITLAHVANIDRYFPIHVATTITVSEIVFEVTTLGAGNARVGIYEADTDWQPTDLVYDSGNVSVATTGVKTATVNLALVAGRYLLALNNSVTFTARVMYLNPPIIGATLGTTTPHKANWTVSRTYAAFPDPGTDWTTVDSNSYGAWYVPLLLGISVP